MDATNSLSKVRYHFSKRLKSIFNLNPLVMTTNRESLSFQTDSKENQRSEKQTDYKYLPWLKPIRQLGTKSSRTLGKQSMKKLRCDSWSTWNQSDIWRSIPSFPSSTGVSSEKQREWIEYVDDVYWKQLRCEWSSEYDSGRHYVPPSGGIAHRHQQARSSSILQNIIR